ncbi:MAG TPA: NFACT family protein, partial [Ignavibacteriaceae bacterium]|nr:NFACT family protein [Ignavibacteriaceae bacterium]
MFKNYFILNRLVVELNNELRGYNIIRSFSYERDKIVFILKNKLEELSIEVSVNPGFPYLNLKRKFSIPKKNLADFFNSYLPLKINSFEISNNDRIIRINSDKASIYFTIRGKYTNLYLINENSEIETFKKTDESVKSNFLNELNKQNFISVFNNLKLDEEFVDPEIIRKTFPIIGKEIFNEVKLREKDP